MKGVLRTCAFAIGHKKRFFYNSGDFLAAAIVGGLELAHWRNPGVEPRNRLVKLESATIALAEIGPEVYVEFLQR